MRKLRLKVHYGGPDSDAPDTRYVMSTPETKFEAVSEQIRAKFGLRGGEVRFKVRDEEGDSITMADQEDWEMAIAGCRAALRKEADGGGTPGEMGRLEVWVQEVA